MAFPQQVIDDIQRAKSFLSQLDADDTSNRESGCVNCEVINYYCLSTTLNSLLMKKDLDQYDEYAIKLYERMLIIIGDYVIPVLAIVDAGPDQSVPVSDSAFFNATIIPGSSPIASIQWTGSGVLTNANTANVTVDGFPIGPRPLKIVVTDTMGRKVSDTAVLTGTAATQKVYYLSKSTNVLPTESEILAASFINIVPGSDDYVVPVNGDYNFHFVAELSSEPEKIRWEESPITDSDGTMAPGNTWFNAGTVTSFRIYGNSFKTEFDNPLRFIS